MKITLSKTQWELIGKKTGWIKTAQTKGDVSDNIYKNQGITYDTSLPQSFVNDARDAGYEVAPHFVWIYPKGNLMGQPGPLTTKAITWLATPKFTKAIGMPNIDYSNIDLSGVVKV